MPKKRKITRVRTFRLNFIFKTIKSALKCDLYVYRASPGLHARVIILFAFKLSNIVLWHHSCGNNGGF